MLGCKRTKYFSIAKLMLQGYISAVLAELLPDGEHNDKTTNFMSLLIVNCYMLISTKEAENVIYFNSFIY